MSIDKNTGEIITLEKAIEFTHLFQMQNPSALTSFYAGGSKISSILEQENCIGIRFYNGYDAIAKKNNLVLVGVDINGEDITDGFILEHLSPCPPNCPKSSPLII
ncbi:hypothetical protein CMT34_17475 [Elizabethkingia anophelis]|nr:hypothetical protein [Elizabethkingia anophelis]